MRWIENKTSILLIGSANVGAQHISY
jgi:hypothetical protein